jgi:hypothetical protein
MTLVIPIILVKIALIIIVIRSVYVAVTSRNWLEILFNLSVALVALYYYIANFHRLF